MNPDVTATTVTTTGNYAWEGYLFLGIIVIAIIILIIVLIYVNRGNTLNVIQSLPNYLIFYPKGNTYLGLKNIPNPTINSGSSAPIGTPFWNSFAWMTPDSTYPLALWKLDVLSQTPNGITKQVQVINTVYNTQTPSPGLGYLSPSPAIGGLLTPSNPATLGLTFTYTQIAINTFTLKEVTNVTRNVIVDDFNFLSLSERIEPAVFKLVPTNNL